MERIVVHVQPQRSRAVLIAVIAGAAAGTAGFFAGVALSGIIEPDDAGLDELLYWFFGGVIGAWIGALSGVGLGLKAAGAAPLASALFWTVGLLLPIGGGAGWLAVSLTDHEDHIPLVVEYGLPVVGLAVTILLGARIARTFREVTPEQHRAV